MARLLTQTKLGFGVKKEHFRCLQRERSSKIIRKRRELRVTEPVAYVFLGVDASLLPTRNLLLITSIFNAGGKKHILFFTLDVEMNLNSKLRVENSTTFVNDP